MVDVLTEKRIEDIYSIKDIENMITLSSFFVPENEIDKEKPKQLKKKKKVTIKKDIDIINIEAWKKFNIDVSETGGCPEWDKHDDNNYEDDYIDELDNEICNIF